MRRVTVSGALSVHDTGIAAPNGTRANLSGGTLSVASLNLPNAAAELTRQVVDFVQSLRRMDLYKNPGIAESINWAQALTSLDCVALGTGLALEHFDFFKKSLVQQI